MMSVSERHKLLESEGLEIESRVGFDLIAIYPFNLRQVKPRSVSGEQKGCMKTPLLLGVDLWEWPEGLGGLRRLLQSLAHL